MEKLHLSLSWDCNENCSFCLKKAPAQQVNRPLPLRECLAMLKRARAAGCRWVSLDGGEPALRPDLPQIIKSALLLGYRKIDVMTNGTRFAEAALVKRLASLAPGIERRLFFCVSLHARQARVSDALTRRPGGHALTVAGIKNLLAAGFTVSVSHVITKPAYKDLPAFAGFILKDLEGVSEAVFSHIYPVVHSLPAVRRLYPRLSLAQPLLDEAVARLCKGKVAVDLGNSEMLPVCLTGGREAFFAEAFLHNSVAAVTYDRNKLDTRDSNKLESMPLASDQFGERNKVKGPACGRCLLAPVCGGVWKFYAELYGFGELRPYGKEFFARLKPRGAAAAVRVDGAMPPAAAARRAMAQALAARLKGRPVRFLFPRSFDKKTAAGVLSFAAALGALKVQRKGQ
ncbi:MAG: radical SAM protein [Elusimicrobiales bacterium]|nr:radical SAM protein [Elusimicrobiales bacterium]